METIYGNQPYEDRVTPITESDRYDRVFVEVEQQIEALFKGLGATVCHGISYAGEPTAQPRIPAEQSEAMKAFGERPA